VFTDRLSYQRLRIQGDGFLAAALKQTTALARATAVQRIAGIQQPVAVGSRVGNERPPRLAIAGDGRNG
jgi:hypothetical protein